MGETETHLMELLGGSGEWRHTEKQADTNNSSYLFAWSSATKGQMYFLAVLGLFIALIPPGAFQQIPVNKCGCPLLAKLG